MLIGRDKEKKTLTDALATDNSQFIAVYGRRRVGKTYLIRESFNYKFAFQFSGAANTPSRKQLARFRIALREQGLMSVPTLTSWMEAFAELRRLINGMPDGKKIIFLDELPWMDAPRSGFLAELEVLWNGWASARKDIVLVVCGSATAWMVNKILQNKGGLHNRLTRRIALKPFTLRNCELMAKSQHISYRRKQLLELYMIFGGIPYYWSLLQRGASVAQEIDRLVFADDGDLHDEFNMLYASLFNKPEPYLKILNTLATKKIGMTRKEIIAATKLPDNGNLSTLLSDLEWCGFIRGYSVPSNKVKDELFQIIDNYTIFYYEFVAGRRNAPNYWQSIIGSTQHNTWCGLAFERVCMWHTNQIKQKLGIAGVLTNEYAWRGKDDDGTSGAQIDLIIDRKDDIVNLCEIKYSDKPYKITSQYCDLLLKKRAIFTEATKTRKAVNLTMITTSGLVSNSYSYEIQNEVVMDDLFK